MQPQGGAIANTYAYKPYGEMTPGQTQTVTQPFTYVGQYGVMAEPYGYYYMRARYYDSGAGRFVSEDPLGFDGGDVNLYAYVAGNPVNGIDPLGLCSSSEGSPLKWVFPDVRIGVDSPIGGVYTELPFATGGHITTVEQGPSFTADLVFRGIPLAAFKLGTGADQDAKKMMVTASVSSYPGGVSFGIDTNLNTSVKVLGPTVNIPLGPGVNGYFRGSYKMR